MVHLVLIVLEADNAYIWTSSDNNGRIGDTSVYPFQGTGRDIDYSAGLKLFNLDFIKSQFS